jgi:RHS repeat-associated protein
VVALLKSTGALAERVSYDPYGVATYRYPDDVNGDGSVTSADRTLVNGLIPTSIGGGGYNADADINRDGVIDSNDYNLVSSTTKSALPSGFITDKSGPDNQFGYDGYVFNPESLLYTVRFRHYDPVLGRWLERDPLSYQAGGNLYAYSRSRPTVEDDPFGLDSTENVEDFWERWVDLHPGFSKKQYEQMHNKLLSGCIGVTCLMLGQKIPDFSNCYSTQTEAHARLVGMTKNCECKGKNQENKPSQPKMFAKSIYMAPGRTVEKDETGRILKPGDYGSAPPIKDSITYDYVYWDEVSRKWIDADHRDGMEGKPMHVTFNDGFPRFSNFNTRFYCVTCQGQEWGSPTSKGQQPPRRPRPGENVPPEILFLP